MNFLGALAANYTIDEIISFIMNEAPNFGKRIKQAKNAGHDAKAILDQLQGLSKEELKKLDKKSIASAEMGLNPLIEAQQNTTENAASTEVPTLRNAGASIGLAVLGAPYLSAAGSHLLDAAKKHAFPRPVAPVGNNAQQFEQSLSSQPELQTQNLPKDISLQEQKETFSLQSPDQNLAPNLPQVPESVQPEGINSLPQTPQEEALRNIEMRKGESKRLFELAQQPRMSKENLTPFMKVARELVKKGDIKDEMEFDEFRKYWDATEGKPRGSSLIEFEKYRRTKPSMNAQQEDSQSKAALQPTNIPIKKTDIVETPLGVGEIKELRNGKAIVEIDGKKHQIKEDEIRSSLYSDDDVAVVYDHLMSIIPEEHRSGFIQWAGYDEDTNTLGFIPRGGKYEELTNITPEEAEKIKEGKGVARTTGANKEGLWAVGEDTRGGIISQIIWDRRKRKEAEEKKQIKFDFNLPKPEKQDRGMKPLFDELAFPRNASRAKEKRIKEEEKARKKKEKDEAKKKKK